MAQRVGACRRAVKLFGGAPRGRYSASPMADPVPSFEPVRTRRGAAVAAIVALLVAGGAAVYFFFFFRRGGDDDLKFVVGDRVVTRRDFTRYKAALLVDDPSSTEAEALDHLIQGLTAAAVLDRLDATITREELEAEGAAFEKARGPDTVAKLVKAFDGDTQDFQLRYVYPGLAIKNLRGRYENHADAHAPERIELKALLMKPWDDAPVWTIDGEKVTGGPIRHARELTEGPLKGLEAGAVSEPFEHPTGFYAFKVIERGETTTVAARWVLRRTFDEYFAAYAQFVNVAFVDKELRKLFETQVAFAKKVKIIEPGQAKAPRVPIR